MGSRVLVSDCSDCAPGIQFRDHSPNMCRGLLLDLCSVDCQSDLLIHYIVSGDAFAPCQYKPSTCHTRASCWGWAPGLTLGSGWYGPPPSGVYRY
jgi:hypothetical protein